MSFGQGGPGWGPGGGPTPDWNALAEQTAATRARRRRWLLIGGGAVATVAIAAVVAVAVVQGSGEGSASDGPTTSLPSPTDLPSGPSQPEPDFTEAPPPPNPYEFISDPEKDTAPRSAEGFFPDATAELDGRAYRRAAVKSTEDCASAAATDDLEKVLKDWNCTEVHRASFTRDGISVTVGIAVLHGESEAGEAAKAAKPYLAPLTGGDVPEDFCRYSACRSSAEAYGRYVFLTVAGYVDGTDVTREETTALAASRDLAAHAKERLKARGREQAAAAASAQPAP
ncbi:MULTISPECIES: hypothetical protein [unclassified Streptomyces]|uniref:hypothetical protein n=1 Tax=unclassified Streptomyces TaxID=2593676 RepID=UPI0022B6A680|nr:MULTISPECIES: hypothetical protein [unclassified Streptomyces]MCZ7417187.1 hypothetical protein [Streptomyces sp. WMMC897]MCZ7432984.1 hypothetical protein [Streptomyces sp. WMMC1477]